MNDQPSGSVSGPFDSPENLRYQLKSADWKLFPDYFPLEMAPFSGDIRSFFFFGVSFLFFSPKDWVISGRGSQATMMGKFMGGIQFCDLLQNFEAW